MSERHTSRIFRQSKGTSIQKYLIQLRLSIAQQRLIEQTQSISEIAYSLGYKNAQHFSTIFHKHTGMTPSAYRSKSGTRLME
jgi:AraC-like DNA-binding protein